MKTDDLGRSGSLSGRRCGEGLRTGSGAGQLPCQHPAAVQDRRAAVGPSARGRRDPLGQSGRKGGAQARTGRQRRRDLRRHLPASARELDLLGSRHSRRQEYSQKVHFT